MEGTLVFTGRMPVVDSNDHVMVRVYMTDGEWSAEIAFKELGDARWGRPIPLDTANIELQP